MGGNQNLPNHFKKTGRGGRWSGLCNPSHFLVDKCDYTKKAFSVVNSDLELDFHLPLSGSYITYIYTYIYIYIYIIYIYIYIYIWMLKNKNINFTIKWSAAATAIPYNCGGKGFDLCLTEKLLIATYHPKTLLKKRYEIVSKCRHQKKFTLKHFK